MVISRPSGTVFQIIIGAAWLASASTGICGDWPQILGPNRDGIADNEKLTDWPADGPEVKWSQQVGQGFAGVAVRGATFVLFHRIDEREIVEARSTADGNVVWSSPAECDYVSGMSSDSGPRCVPLISGEFVYTFGASGILRCHRMADGEEIWRRDTWSDFGAPEGYFGAGSTPLLVDDQLIVNVGGRNGAAVVAFNLETGKTTWQKFDDTASYSSPVSAEFNGHRYAVAVTRLNVVAFDTRNGDIAFQFPFGARGPTVNGATPVVWKDRLFVSSSYRVGSILAHVKQSGVETKHLGESLLATQYATPVRQGNLIYAVDGRQDVGDASVCCIDLEQQKVLWRKPGFDYGSLLRVSDEILFLTCNGELIRFKANPLAYVEIARHQMLNPTPRGYRLPAVANGRLYIRDDDALKCVVVGQPSESAPSSDN